MTERGPLKPANFAQHVVCELRHIATSGEPPQEWHHCPACGASVWTKKNARPLCKLRAVLGEDQKR